MANVGRLNVDLVARTGRFKAGLKDAGSSVSRFSSSMATAGKLLRVGIVGGLAAGTAAFYGLSRTILSTADKIDSLAKSSDKLGITTEALAGLRHAGNLSGVAIESMDKGLEKMIKNVAEAATGTGIVADTLDRLGFNAYYLTQLAPEQQFYAIADAMNQMGSQSSRVLAAYQIFGRAGVSLLNVTSSGSKGLKEMQQEAVDLGIAISRIDAKQVEEMNDAIDRGKSAMEGLKNTLTISVAPVIAQLAKDFTEYVKNMEKGSDALKGRVESLATVVGGLITTWGKLARAAGIVSAIPEGAFYGVRKLAEAIGLSQKGGADLMHDYWADTWAQWGKGAQETSDKFVEKVISGFGAVKTSIQAATDAAKKHNEALSGTAVANAALLDTEIKRLETMTAIDAKTGTIGQGSRSDFIASINQNISGRFDQAGHRITQAALDVSKEQLKVLIQMRDKLEPRPGYAT